MVGSFFKVFLVTMTLLVANSEAFKCAVKGNMAEATEMSRLVQPMEDFIKFRMNVKLEEECNGMCITVALSGGGEIGEVAGCQGFPATRKKFVDVFAIHNKVPQGTVELTFFGCNWDNCIAVGHPNHATMKNIQKAVNDQAAILDKPSSANLKCHNDNEVSEACSGVCVVGNLPKKVCDPKTKSADLSYQLFTYSLAPEGAASQVGVSVECSTDNCNAAGSVGEQAMKSIESKVKAELATVQFSAGNNSSYGLVVALFILIIWLL